MSELIPYDPREDRSYDDQLRDALEHALTIQGSVINDLEAALNCILQMERAMRMTGTPNPNEATANYLRAKYKKSRETTDRYDQDSRKLLERVPLYPIEIVGPKAELVESTDEIVDAEVVDD